MTTPRLDSEIAQASEGFMIVLRRDDDTGLTARPLHVPLDLTALPRHADIAGWIRQVRI